MAMKARKPVNTGKDHGTLAIGAPNPEGWGPWVGVPEDRQTVCAVVDCVAPGKPHACFADGGNHHHGCVHYQHLRDDCGLTFRKSGWCWLCDGHYNQLREANLKGTEGRS